MGEEAREPAAVPRKLRVSSRVGKRLALAGLLAIWSCTHLVVGLSGSVDPDTGAPVLIIALYAAVIVWFGLDRQERGLRIGILVNTMVFLCMPIGVPLYLIVTRRVRGLLSIAGLVLYVVTLSLASALAYALGAAL